MSVLTRFFIELRCSSTKKPYAARGSQDDHGVVALEVEDDLDFVRLGHDMHKFNATGWDMAKCPCPFCGSPLLVKCAECDRLSCAGSAGPASDINGRLWKCGWCPAGGRIGGHFESFTAQEK